jgi:diguanylate cyclase (GGDEF)-like protein/PAS domain S-box-containing protein
MPELIMEAARPTAEALLEAMSDAVYAVDAERRITYWNSAAERLTGYRAAEVVGRYCHDNLLNDVDDAGRQLCWTGCPLLATIDDGSVFEVRMFLRHRDGHRVPVAVRLDVAEREALTDPLTGIANRRMLERALELRGYEDQRYNRRYAVVFIDVDDFKQFNERYGHDVGDEVLRLVATTLRYFSRPSDTAGRWGGDEFLLVAPVKDLEQALGLAERVRHLVANASLVHNGVRVAVTVTAGVALACPSEPTLELVNRASLVGPGPTGSAQSD